MSLLQKFTVGCEKFPYISQGLVAGGLQVIGDIIAQHYERKEKFDYRRTWNFALIGFFTGLGLRKWYGFLDEKIPSGNRFVSSINKVAANQFIFTPIFTCVSTTSIGFLQGKDINEAINLLRREFLDIMIADCKVWPAVQFFNFFFVPLHLQVCCNSVVAIAWNSYFSYKTCSNRNENSTETLLSHKA